MSLRATTTITPTDSGSSTKRDSKDQAISAATKRQKTSATPTTSPALISDTASFLLDSGGSTTTPRLASSLLPSSLQDQSLSSYSTNLSKLKAIFDETGFRTSVVYSPRGALSIYRDSCILERNNDEEHQTTAMTISHHPKAFLLTMLGLHPHQEDLEEMYQREWKGAYCLQLFCVLVIQQKCDARVMEHSAVQECVRRIESDLIEPLLSSMDNTEETKTANAAILADQLTRACATADPRLRLEQLQREYDRLVVWNSTLTNACLQRFVDYYSSPLPPGAESFQLIIKDIYWKQSAHKLQYERMTIYLYDPSVDELKPPRFTFLPCLTTLLTQGPTRVMETMMEHIWTTLLVQHGYFGTPKLKHDMQEPLYRFLSNGLSSNWNLPIQLNAHFTPTTSSLSLYLYGRAGSGKSSLVRHFAPALQATLEHYMDPELCVRWVKQNLNKPNRILELEFQLKPNNNDRSVMSVIQGRRMSMTQSKPGLVLVDLEEMSQYVEAMTHEGTTQASSTTVLHDPNQLDTVQLLAQRFAGRTGAFVKTEVQAPRNSTKRGMNGDASVMVVFTSNYHLHNDSMTILQQRCPAMFQHLKELRITAVEGKDREDFCRAYLKQQLLRNLPNNVFSSKSGTGTAVSLGQLRLFLPSSRDGHEADTRPLVRFLRMLAYWIGFLVSDSKEKSSIERIVSVTMESESAVLINMTNPKIEYRMKLQNGLLMQQVESASDTSKQHDSRSLLIVKELKKNSTTITTDLETELTYILDYYFSETLTPVVVLSDDANKIRCMMKAMAYLTSEAGGNNDRTIVQTISGIDPSEYKMMKSLYDAKDTKNLRDDILALGKGAWAAIELLCGTNEEAQLCIREMIEDSPSLTAFSTNKSALYKNRLFFAVHVAQKSAFTPEVRSRASIII